MLAILDWPVHKQLRRPPAHWSDRYTNAKDPGWRLLIGPPDTELG
jgi:hypothetical protein